MVVPDRYQIARVGTPDPDTSRYVVLDIVHDWTARVALRRLVNLYLLSGAPMHAQELEQFLESTEPAARALIDARNARYAPRRRR